MESWNPQYKFNKVLRETKLLVLKKKNNSEFREEDLHLNSLFYWNVNCLGGLSLHRESVVRLTDCPVMTLDVYRGRKSPMQHQQQYILK